MLSRIIQFFKKYFKNIVSYVFLLELTVFIIISGCSMIPPTPVSEISTEPEEAKCFKITEDSLIRIRRAGVTKGLMDELKSLKDQTFINEEAFEKAIVNKIGWLRMIQYKRTILERVETECPLPEWKCFKLTEQSLKILKKKGFSEKAINRLKELKGKAYASKEMFLSAVGKKIGKKAIELHKSLILKSAGREKECITSSDYTCFELTNQSLIKLKNKGIPINKLIRKRGKTYNSKENFLQDLEKVIGKNQVAKYKTVILAYTGRKCPTQTSTSTQTSTPSIIKYIIIGKSVEGRDIDMIEFGSGEDATLIMASIRGDRRAGKQLLEELEAFLKSHLNLLNGRKVFLIPVVNPDGVFNNTLSNARGINLNKSFPGGTKALQPEIEAVTEVIERYLNPKRKKRIISVRLFQNLDYDGPGRDLAEHMGKYCNLRVKKLGASAGSLGNYTGERLGIPTITFGIHKNAENLDSQQLWEQYGAALMASILYPDPPPSYLQRDIPPPPPLENIHYTKAKKYFYRGRWTDCIKEARKVTINDPSYEEAMQLKRKAEEKEENSKKDEIEPSPPPKPDDKEVEACKEAIEAIKREKMDEAEELIDNIPENATCREDTESLYKKAKENIKKKDISKAKQQIEKGDYVEATLILMKYENDKEARENIHTCYLQIGQKLDKDKDYLNAIKAFQDACRYKKSAKCDEYIKNSKNKYCEVHYNKAWELYKAENLEKALSEYKKVESVSSGYKDTKKMIEAICGLITSPECP